MAVAKLISSQLPLARLHSSSRWLSLTRPAIRQTIAWLLVIGTYLQSGGCTTTIERNSGPSMDVDLNGGDTHHIFGKVDGKTVAIRRSAIRSIEHPGDRLIVLGALGLLAAPISYFIASLCLDCPIDFDRPHNRPAVDARPYVALGVVGVISLVVGVTLFARSYRLAASTDTAPRHGVEHLSPQLVTPDFIPTDARPNKAKQTGDAVASDARNT